VLASELGREARDDSVGPEARRSRSRGGTPHPHHHPLSLRLLPVLLLALSLPLSTMAARCRCLGLRRHPCLRLALRGFPVCGLHCGAVPGVFFIAEGFAC